MITMSIQFIILRELIIGLFVSVSSDTKRVYVYGSWNVGFSLSNLISFTVSQSRVCRVSRPYSTWYLLNNRSPLGNEFLSSLVLRLVDRTDVRSLHRLPVRVTVLQQYYDYRSPHNAYENVTQIILLTHKLTFPWPNHHTHLKKERSH